MPSVGDDKWKGMLVENNESTMDGLEFLKRLAGKKRRAISSAADKSSDAQRRQL
jgi:hypothetical protein